MTRPTTIADVIQALKTENRINGPASIRALVKRSGYAAATVKRAIAELEADGRARSVRGYGGHLAWEFVERFAMDSAPAAESEQSTTGKVRNECVQVEVVSTPNEPKPIALRREVIVPVASDPTTPEPAAPIEPVPVEPEQEPLPLAAIDDMRRRRARAERLFNYCDMLGVLRGMSEDDVSNVIYATGVRATAGEILRRIEPRVDHAPFLAALELVDD